MTSKLAEVTALAGKVMIVGFEGTTLPDDLQTAAAEGTLAGVVLFKRNIESAEQVSDMLHELRLRAPEDAKPIASVDQEGGRVERLGPPLTSLPPARRFGELDNPKLTETAGRLVGRGLRALGFTLNYAPVLDVDTHPDSPIIGDRAYGDTPLKVIRHGLAFARGLKDGGLVPCAKHFPGHGDAGVDSHRGLPSVAHDRERLSKIEMEPFAAWSRFGIGAVMTAHMIFSALDQDNPATTSRTILKEELKNRLRFKGPILSDDLEMGAIDEIGDRGTVAVRAVRAGVDGLLICRSQDVQSSVREALAREALGDPAFHQLLIEAAKHLAPLAYPPGASAKQAWFGSPEQRALEETVLAELEETR
jgi:beta-N-acetylhexosaminidase